MRNPWSRGMKDDQTKSWVGKKGRWPAQWGPGMVYGEDGSRLNDASEGSGAATMNEFELERRECRGE